MKKLLLKSLIITGALLSTLHGIDNIDVVEKYEMNIPNTVKLNVVYIPQNDNKSCATTSVAMVISYYENLNDKPLDKETVWNISGSNEETICASGNDMEGLKRIADHYGYKSEFIEEMEIADIEHFLSNGIPIILNIKFKKTGTTTHAILVIGYDSKKKIFYINDPENSEKKKLEYADLEARWSTHLSFPYKISYKSGFIVYPKKREVRWCYPEFSRKYKHKALFTPKNRLEYYKTQGKYPSFQPPKTLLIFYNDEQVDIVLKKYRYEKCDGCFKDIYFLKDYPGVAFAKFGVAAPINAMKLDLAIEWGIKEFISVGGACSLQKNLNYGDIVVCDSAIRNEGVSHHYLPPGKYVNSPGKIKNSLLKNLNLSGVPYKVGMMMTTDAIFRLTAQEVEMYQKEGVLCTDMELASQYAVASAHDDVEMIGLFAIMSDSFGNGKWERHPFPDRRKAWETIFDIALQTAFRTDKNISFKREVVEFSLPTSLSKINFNSIIELAEKGCLSARLLLIHLYIEGIGIKSNMHEAEMWMLKVSTQMNQINDQEKIILFKKDFEEVKKNIKKQIRNNSLLGAYEGILGYMYLRGWGIDKSIDEAFFHLNIAVKLGNNFSMVDLGKMYQEGMGAKQDYLKAYNLYQVAANKGISAAYYRLYFMYEKGIGIEKDIKKAEECFTKSQFMFNKNIKKNNIDGVDEKNRK